MKRRRRTLRWAIVIAVPLSVAVWASSRAQAPVNPSYVGPAKARTCPLGVVGARVSLHDRDDGVDVTFTADRNVEQLRRRVRNQAADTDPALTKDWGTGASTRATTSTGFASGTCRRWR